MSELVARDEKFSRENVIQETLIDGDVSLNIYEIRKILGVEKNAVESLTKADFQSMKGLNMISLMSKAPQIKPRIKRLGTLMAEALNDHTLANRCRQYPEVVGLALGIWGTGTHLTRVLGMLASNDPNEYIINQLKETFPDFGGTLDLIMMGLNSVK